VGGTKGRVSRTDNDDVTDRRQHAFQPILLLRRRLPAFGSVARLDFVLGSCMQQMAKFVIEGRQFVGFSGISRIAERQNGRTKTCVTMLKAEVDVSFSQSEIFLR
jgi:hypothetical protein